MKKRVIAFLLVVIMLVTSVGDMLPCYEVTFVKGV